MTTLADVETTFTTWLQMKSTEPLKVALATVAANRLPGDPYWQFLVAPPSGLKTEIITALNGVPEIYPLSSLTTATFASGFTIKGRKNPSLLFKLDGRVLAMKDFTSVLSMHNEKRSEILGQLREVYDGAYHKEFGNGEVVDWVGRIGLIAGVTPIIDMQYTVTQVLGERFLLYRLQPDDPILVARQARTKLGQERAMREDLLSAVRAFFAGLRADPVIETPSVIGDRLNALACLTARSRSGVLWGHDGTMLYVPAPEGPGRLAKQLSTLAIALAMIRGSHTVSLEDYATVYRVAIDTAPLQRTKMLEVLKDPTKKQWTTTEVGEVARYPSATARRYLEELTAVDLVDREVAGQGKADLWSLSALARAWIATTEIDISTQSDSRAVLDLHPDGCSTDPSWSIAREPGDEEPPF
jgi:hypothetical protein